MWKFIIHNNCYMIANITETTTTVDAQDCICVFNENRANELVDVLNKLYYPNDTETLNG